MSSFRFFAFFAFRFFLRGGGSRFSREDKVKGEKLLTFFPLPPLVLPLFEKKPSSPHQDTTSEARAGTAPESRTCAPEELFRRS